MSNDKPDILAALAQDIVPTGEAVDDDVLSRLQEFTSEVQGDGRQKDLPKGVVRGRVRPPRVERPAPSVDAEDSEDASLGAEGDDGDDAADTDRFFENLVPVPRAARALAKEAVQPVAAPTLTQRVARTPPPPAPAPASPAAADAEQDDDVTKRKRMKNGMANAAKVPTFQGIPLPQIQEANELYQSLSVKVYRRNTRGHLAMVGMWDKSPTELADIDMWLKEMWGGGRYRVEARNPENPTEYATPIPPFEVEVDGPMKAPNYSPGGGGGPTIAGGMHEQSAFAPAQGNMPYGMPPMMPGAYGPSQGHRVDPRQLPPFVRNMEPMHQQAYAQQMGLTMPEHGAYTQPVMKFTPDQLMKEELDRAQATLERERREREMERKAAAAALEQARKESEARHNETQRRLEQIERQNMEDRIKEREQASQREIAMLRAEMQAGQNRKPAIDPALVGTVLTAIAPVITAMVTSGRDAQNRTLELQSKGVSDLMQATLARSDKNPLLDTLKTAVPLLAPFLKDWWDSKSPRAQADLVATMAENQLTSIGMMARLVNDFSANMGGSDGAPPWWLPVVQETMRGVTQAAEKLTQTSKAAVPQVVSAPPQNAQNAQPQAQAQQSNPYAAYTGAQIAQFIFSDSRLPQGFKTREWMHILTIVHDRRQPVEDVAKVIATHIRTLDDNLPEGLTQLWDTDNPETVLMQLFGMLPISQMDATYTAQLVDGIVNALSYDASEAPEGTPPPVSQVAAQQAAAQPAQQPVSYNMDGGPLPFPYPTATPQKVG